MSKKYKFHDSDKLYFIQEKKIASIVVPLSWRVSPDIPNSQQRLRQGRCA